MRGVPSLRCPGGDAAPFESRTYRILLEISLALSVRKAAGAARWPLRYAAAVLRPTRHG